MQRLKIVCLAFSFLLCRGGVHGFHSWSRSSSFLTGYDISRCSKTNSQHDTEKGRSNRNGDRACPLSMKVKVGIVGLPNIGKSTLFNALAQKSIAQAENFPFCTIEPNVAPIAVPDPHLQKLGQWANSVATVPATMEFVDVAGLVAGASRGEGLGNRFLATIRECHAICHVLRSFDTAGGGGGLKPNNIIHINGRVDPVEDADIVNLELVLADVAHVERRLTKKTKTTIKATENDYDDDEERLVLEKILPQLQKGIPARAMNLSIREEFAVRSMGLLTLKPVIYVFNVDDVDFLLAREQVLENAQQMMSQIQYCDPTKDLCAVVSAKLEAEIATLQDASAQQEFLEGMGVLEELENESLEPFLDAMMS